MRSLRFIGYATLFLSCVLLQAKDDASQENCVAKTVEVSFQKIVQVWKDAFSGKKTHPDVCVKASDSDSSSSPAPAAQESPQDGTQCASSKGMNGVEVITSLSTVPNAPQAQRTAVADSSASWDQILAQEHALAQAYFKDKPDASASTAETSPKTEPKAEVTEHTTYKSLQTAQEVQKEVPKAVTRTSALPVESFTKEKGLLKMAHVKFDPQHQLWSATWQKPGIFHFGMLLRPALAENLTPGKSYSFQANGQPAVLTCTQDKELVLQRGGEKTDLSASELRDLLHDQITVNGISLFLDTHGNLVMEAHGSKALAMANVNL